MGAALAVTPEEHFVVFEPARVFRRRFTLLLEQNAELQIQHRYMQLEALHALSDNQQACLSAVVQ